MDSTGLDALSLSAASGESKMTALLLEAGAEVDRKSPDEATPLMFAAGGNYLDTARLLIAQGANVNAQDKFGNTPLMWAVFSGRPVDASDPNGLRDLTSTSISKPHTRSEMIRLLLSNGASSEITNKEGKTALMLAKAGEDAEAVTLLLLAKRSH